MQICTLHECRTQIRLTQIRTTQIRTIQIRTSQIRISQFRTSQYIHGAFPEYGFHRWEGPTTPPGYTFAAPRLKLHQGMLKGHFQSRLALLRSLDRQRRHLDQAGGVKSFGRYRQQAATMLAGGGVHRALDVHAADDKLQRRYGKNSFGWSLLMARQLVEAGINLVQVNLGNNESWDTHDNNFTTLRRDLMPQLDAAMSTLFRDLADRGMLDSTMVLVTGEFGRTPRINANAGRDHWGPGFTVAIGGGGIQGGRIVGRTNERAERPDENPYRPEDLAATMHTLLGIHPKEEFITSEGRPVPIVNDGQFIQELI